MRKQNPHGIHFFKGISVTVMMIVHSMVWVANAWHYRYPIRDSGFGWKLASMFGMWALIIPGTAGCALRLALGPKIENGKLKDYSLGSAFLLFGFLALLESTKGALTYGLEIFYGWNVLHMIGLSLLLVLILMRFSIDAVWLSGVLAVAIRPWAVRWFSRLQVTDMRTFQWLNEIGFAQMVLFGSVTLALLVSIYLIFFRLPFQMKYKVRIALLVFLVYDAVAFAIPHYQPSVYFGERVFNLAAGAIVGASGHFWPLLPWHATVVFGFVLYHILETLPDSRRFSSILFGASLVMIAIYLRFYASTYIHTESHDDMWSYQMYQIPAGPLWGIFGLMSFAISGLDLLCTSDRFWCWVERFPLIYRVPYVYSRTILWAYIFSTSIVIPMVPPFLHLRPLRLTFYGYAAFVCVTWYFIGDYLLQLLDGKRWTIRFSIE